MIARSAVPCGIAANAGATKSAKMQPMIVDAGSAEPATGFASRSRCASGGLSRGSLRRSAGPGIFRSAREHCRASSGRFGRDATGWAGKPRTAVLDSVHTKSPLTHCRFAIIFDISRLIDTAGQEDEDEDEDEDEEPAPAEAELWQHAAEFSGSSIPPWRAPKK